MRFWEIYNYVDGYESFCLLNPNISQGLTFTMTSLHSISEGRCALGALDRALLPLVPQGLAVISSHRQVHVKREGRTLFFTTDAVLGDIQLCRWI
jgi:hypothetical protein